MKPLNSNKESCSPISSNCVIWQGPDISCIGLCKGDSVSDVVYKLATELCTIMEQTNVDNYTLNCLAPQNCGPSTFPQLIQLIIDKLCSCCENGSSPSPTTSAGCPDCEIPIAECFRYTNQFGDLVVSMNLTDYAIAIGNKVCTIVNQIITINQTLANHENRITNLENIPAPVFTLPKVTPVCVLPSNPTDMNIVLSALEAAYCQLIGATGSPQDIYEAIVKQCAGLTAAPQLGGAGTMGNLSGWSNNIVNLADAINNIWLTICDLRASVVNIQTNCCPGGCEGIALSIYAELDGTTLILFPTGTVPSGFLQCAPGTTTYTITDQSGNTVSQSFNFLANLNGSGYPLDLSSTPLNLNDDLTIVVSPCLENQTSGSQCSYQLMYVLAYQGECPTMIYTPADTNIVYSGSVTSGDGLYQVELWNNAGNTLLGISNHTVTAPATINGSFAGLTPSTFYKLRVKFTPALGGTATYCPFQLIQTNATTCPDPQNVVATITE